jgi:uncharacterized protein YraI
VKSERKFAMNATNSLHKRITILIAVVLTLGFLIPNAPAFAKQDEIAIVGVPALNLRTGPSLENGVLQVIHLGDQVSILDQSEDLLWARVQLESGTRGWVYRQYLQSISEANSQVLLDGLRLRVGPGFTSRTIQLLSKGQELDLTGRSQQSDWLLVRLPNGTTGWVFGVYVSTSINVASLPVAEASGGPDGSGGSETRTSVVVTIKENQAFVDVKGYPTSQDIVASLGLPGKSPDLKVASGTTKADGSARLSFPMPTEWSNGKPVNQDHLVLQVSLKDGSHRISVDVVYLHY